MFTDDGYYTYTYKVNMADDGNSWAGYTTSSSGSTKTVSFVRLQGPIIEAENWHSKTPRDSLSIAGIVVICSTRGGRSGGGRR